MSEWTCRWTLIACVATSEQRPGFTAATGQCRHAEDDFGRSSPRLFSMLCRSERAAVHARLSVVVPELEVLESAWARLHGMCGASNAEELIAHWTGERAIPCRTLSTHSGSCSLCRGHVRCLEMWPAVSSYLKRPRQKAG